jgi:hypothetical protein
MTMIEKIIGDRKKFAVQYSMSSINISPPYGDCRIWLNGYSLGGIEGEVYLTRVCKVLQSLCPTMDEISLPENLYSLSSNDIFRIMKEEKIDEKGTYWFMNTEGFDLSSKYVYRRQENLYFLWQLNPNAWNDFKTGDYPGQIFSAVVSVSLYNEVAEQFKAELMKIYPAFK